EDYNYHMFTGQELILGAHMLEVCPSIAAGTPRVEVHPLGIGNREDPVRLVFDAAPGDGIVLGTSDLGDRFRFVANDIHVVPPLHDLPHLPVARAVWRPEPDLATSAEAWLTAGGPHHTVLSTALTADHLHTLADMTGTELVHIDPHTTVRRLRQELRWAAAYHRLAQGL
ncbi:MAG: L-arabinose isomerase, partial [Nocardioidaceae bacterium]|nr:L-arabinose isomerase [Nocardioidaceae bacterium]